jgi:drug/metabolite transporter (DMT)-like permease
MKREYFFAAVSIICWGSTAAVTKLLLNTSSSMQVLFYSSFLATAVLFIFNAASRRLGELRSYRGCDFARLIPLGLLGLFVYNLLLYTGIDQMLAQDAFILNYLWPIMTVVFSCIILKEKMSGRTVIALIISFVGVAVVLTKGDLSSVHMSDALGIVCSLAAAVCYGLFSALNKREQADPFVNMMLYYGASTVVSGLYLVVSGEMVLPAISQLPGILWIGVFVHALGYSCWARALKTGNTARISNLAFITPFLSLVYVYFLLHEKIGLFSVIGLVIIIFGVLFQMKKNAAPTAAKTSH